MQVFDILNFLNFFLPLFWLAGILIYWAKHKQIKIWWIKYGLLVIAAFYIVWGAYFTAATYNLWKIHPISRYLLPPHQAAYFYEYSFYHYWLPNLANLIAGVAWLVILYVLYKYSRGRFLDKEEIWLGFFTALAVGWPKFIIYLALFFGLMLARQIIDVMIFKKNKPFQVAPYLIVGAIAALIAGEFLVNKLNLGVLRI